MIHIRGVDVTMAVLGITLLLSCWIGALSLGFWRLDRVVPWSRDFLRLLSRLLHRFVGPIICKIFNHPINLDLAPEDQFIAVQSTKRTVKYYCPRCGAWMLTQYDLNRKAR